MIGNYMDFIELFIVVGRSSKHSVLVSSIGTRRSKEV